MKNRKILFKHLFIGLVVLLLTNCEDFLNPGNKKKKEKNSLYSTKWYLKEIQHTDTQIKEIVPTDLLGMNVLFSDTNRLHAISSCNMLDGDFITSGIDSIRIFPLAQTERLCHPDYVMLWESTFKNNLEHSCKYAIIDGTLSITTNINTVMIFE